MGLVLLVPNSLFVCTALQGPVGPVVASCVREADETDDDEGKLATQAGHTVCESAAA